MFSAYITANNSTLTQQELVSGIQDDLINAKTNGYQGKKFTTAGTSFGKVITKKYLDIDTSAPFFMRGEKLTKIAISKDRKDAHFLLTDGKKNFLTRVGDFTFSQRKRVDGTYLGKPNESRRYLVSTDGDKLLLGRPIGEGPITQDKRPRDPLLLDKFPDLSQSPIYHPKQKIGGDKEYAYGPLIPIDLTRGKNGLILNRYSKVQLSKKGVIEGYLDGLWIPLYKIQLCSVSNPHGLHQIGNSTLKRATPESGAIQEIDGVEVLGEHIEKSNVSEKYSSYRYKSENSALRLAIVMSRNNQQILQRYQNLLNGQ